MFVQIIGGIAFVFLFISYFMKKKDNILFFQIISYLIFAIHYFLLGAFTGSLLEVGCSLGALINRGKVLSKQIYVLFLCLLYIVISIISFNNWYSIIPTITVILTTLGLAYGNTKIIKLTGIVSCVGWALYSFFVKSYVSIYTNIFLIIFIIISIILRGKNEG